MLSINDWFKHYAKKPLILLGLLAFGIQVIFIYHNFARTELEQTSRVKNLVDKIANTAIEQKNRDVLEATFAVAVDELGAKFILLCKGDRAYVSYPLSQSECESPLKESFFLRRIEMTASGYTGYRFIFFIPKWNFSGRFLWLSTISSLFLVVFFLVVARVQRKLKKDVFLPVASNFFDQKMEILEFENLKKMIEKSKKADSERIKIEAKEKMEQKFAHNIQSPLGNIKILRDRLRSKIDPSSARLFDNIVQQISDMTLSYTENTAAISVTDDLSKIEDRRSLVEMSELMEASVSAKTLELSEAKRSVNLVLNNKVERGTFIEAVPVEMRAILSNMINNSVDSGATRIELTIQLITSNSLSIVIKDDGSGVDESLADRLFSKGATFGKTNGTGFGLYHAKEFVTKWDGSIRLLKTASTGTQFEIKLPVYEIPEIKIGDHSQVVILEDTKEERMALKKKIDESSVNLSRPEVIEFESSKAALEWFENTETPIADVILFADNDLGPGETTGLQLINHLGISQLSYLVTSGFSSPSLVRQCREFGVRLIPKGYLSASTFSVT